MPSVAAQCEAACKVSCRDILAKSKMAKSKMTLDACVAPCKTECMASLQPKPKPTPKPKAAVQKPKAAAPRPKTPPTTTPGTIDKRTTFAAYMIRSFEYHDKDTPPGLKTEFLSDEPIKRRKEFGLPRRKGSGVDELALWMGYEPYRHDGQKFWLRIKVSSADLVAHIAFNGGYPTALGFTYDSKADTLDLRSLDAADAAAVRQLWPKSRMRKFVVTAVKDMEQKARLHKFEKASEHTRGRVVKVTNLGSQLVNPSDPVEIQNATRKAAARDYGRVPIGRKSPPGHAGDFASGTVARGVNGRLWRTDGSHWRLYKP
jgi:hypothetical protein